MRAPPSSSSSDEVGDDDSGDDDTADPDNDGDGLPFSTDDDDFDATVYPGAPEACDGKDTDCDGSIPADEDDDDCDGGLSGPEVDDGGDGYDECMDGDCDDSNEDVYPGAPEICDGIEDNDCDGLTDPVDLDNDGDGWSECEGDCDDTDDLIAPDMNDDCFDGIDFRIAVVTTDSEGFVGSPTVIDPSTPNPEAVFSASTLVGTNGNYLEQGLLYGWNATVLAEAGTPPNDGFYRADAGLQVVFLSDEPDQSPDQTPGWWQDYVDDFVDLKADPEMVHLNSIVATDGAIAVDCSGPGGYGYAGYGYVEAALATDGLLTSICDLDWSLLMSDLGTQSIEMATTFTLSYIAVPGTVEVWVNGIQWFTDWSYDPGANAIVFDIMNVPDYGDLIDIYYQY